MKTTGKKSTKRKDGKSAAQIIPRQLGYYFDQTRCTGCYTCTVACKDWHDIPAGPANWLRVATILKGKFPNLFLAEGTEVRIHTGQGDDTAMHLYWNRDTAVWEEQGDTVVLADERGVIYASKTLD